tara:strand:- start:1003 stop:3366 length:2364 start_codon:yes stop_codon:yes gene_type:complete
MNENKELEKLYESIHLINEKQGDNVITEGAWETIKYGLSKLGRYKAGGKILGKKKVTKDTENKIRDILNKESNKLLRGLDSEIRNVSPEFPNDKKRVTFLRGVITIGTLYDSIVEATKKNPDDKGHMPVDAANSIISDLREMVKKYLDVDLAGVYTTMESKEGEENILTENELNILKLDVLTEQEIYLLSEKGFFGKIGSTIGKGLGAIKKGKDKLMDKSFGAKKGSDKPTKSGSGQSAKMQKTSGSKEFETNRMGKGGLESNTLPIVLNMIGGAMGAYSWLTNTEWFKSLFQEEITYTDTEQVKELVDVKTDVLTEIKNGEGVYSLLNRVTGVDVDASSSPQEFITQLKEIGGGDPHKGIDLLCQDGGVMMKPGEAAEGLHNLVDNPDSVNNMGEFFKGTASGTGKLSEPGTGLDTTLYGTKAGSILKSILVKKLPVIITKVVTKTVIKTGAAYYTAKGLGKLLGPLGIGLVATGLVVKLMREKGQRQSRAKTLDDLLQSLRDIEPTKQNPPAIEQVPETTQDNEGDEETTPTTAGEPKVPSDFLKGNRNMQLAYLASNFLPEGDDFWTRLNLKKGTVIPSGFLDASLGQGKGDSEKYLKAFYKHLEKENSFNKKLNVGAWLATVRSNKNLALIKWVRNTRKGVGSFLNVLRKQFDEFKIGERQEAKVSKPGQRGQAMGLAGESYDEKGNLIVEANLGKSASEAGYDEKTFMKNLPQFMSMLSAMYYSTKGTPLPYDKEAVLDKCGEYGCKGGSSKKYKKTKHSDYKLKGQDYMSEEIKRIKSLMK